MAQTQCVQAPNNMNSNCTFCGRKIAFWQKVMAASPFTFHCPKCGTRIFVRERRIVNIVAQLVATIVFYFTALFLFDQHAGVVLSLIGGLLSFIFVALIPVFFYSVRSEKNSF